MNDIETYRLLIVDDNESIHNDLKKILLQNTDIEKEMIMQELKSQLFEEKKEERSLPFNYEIDSAFQSSEAIEFVKNSLEQKQGYALAFVDVLLPPGNDGIETTKSLWDLDPNIQVVICTAYAEYSWNALINLFGINDNFLILKKPFESIEIRQMVCCLTQKWKLAQQVGHKYDRLREKTLEESEKLKKLLDAYQD